MSREVGYQLLSRIEELLGRLEEFRRIKDASKFIDFDLATERLITLLVEIANDLVCHLLLAHRRSVPANYYEVLGKAGQLGWLSPDLVERLQKAAKMRSILIHAYGRIDPEIVRKSIPDALKDFKNFSRQIKPLVDVLPEK